MMTEDVGLTLTVLRIIRGWTQEELAKTSGVRGGSISDYERGRMTPGLKTLKKLTAAMGFSLVTLERTQSFIQTLQSGNPTAAASDTSWGPEIGNRLGLEEQIGGTPSTCSPALLQEVEQVSVEAGRVVSRMTRLMFVLMAPSASPVQGDQDRGTTGS